MQPLDAASLKEQHRRVRDGQTQHDSTRLHRAISWLTRAEQERDDLDARFIFQWVALNAAYACEFNDGETERKRFRGFIDTLVALDREKSLHNALFLKFSGPIRTLIANKYVFEPFWAALRAHDPSERWKQSFAGSQRAAMAAIINNETGTVLAIVFDRLYVLRNQLIHGGATWNSQVNRHQLRDAVAILETLVPQVVQIMLANPDHDFGEIQYPVT
ncbi:MAG: HEPN domain-containing protein [Xanthomonadales bacterium]|nr:HEPN domain-containing protein [Xanthomonadales bacterium]